MKMVSIDNLTFGYNESLVFEKLMFNVSKGSFTTVLGSGGSGKSTLFKILGGEIESSSVLICEKSVSYARSKCYVGFISPDLNYRGTVRKILTMVLENKGKTEDKIDTEVLRISKKLNIDNILDYSFKDLYIKEKILVMFARELLNRPKVLVIDNSFTYLDNEIDNVIVNLKRVFKKTKCIINISNNSEECLYGDEIFFLDNMKKISVNDVSEEDFSSLGLEVPFMILLSERLKFYNLVKDNYLDMEKLVDELWQ